MNRKEVRGSWARMVSAIVIVSVVVFIGGSWVCLAPLCARHPNYTLQRVGRNIFFELFSDCL